MREILFKGQKKGNKEWIKGYYAVIGTRHVIIKAQSEDYYSVDDSLKKCHGNEIIEVDPETVCQYTGLHDNTKWEELSEVEQQKFLLEWNFEKNRQNTKEDWNGRKIFEGDIVSAWSEGSNATGRVKQRIDGLWLLYPAWQKKIMWGLCPNDKGETTVEVIGNVFDNPELLAEVFHK